MNVLKVESSEKQFIYHYTQVSTALEKILPNLQLRFSSMKELHDPREYKDWEFTLGYKNSHPVDPYESHKIRVEMNNFIKNKIKIACFCISDYDQPNKPKYGYCKNRMWSQYTKGHTGICFVILRDKMVDLLTDNKVKVFDGKVQYKECSIPNFDKLTIDCDRFLSDKEKYTLEYVTSHQSDMIFTKQHDYKDETEYRLAFYDKDSNNNLIDISGSLRGIILGDNFNDSYLPSIKNFVKEHGLFCYKHIFNCGDSWTEEYKFKDYDL